MQSQFSTSSVSNRNIQHGDTVGANPAQAPQVSNSTFINDNDPRLDQETTRGIFWRPTQNQESLHSPENDHELHLPNTPANRNPNRQEGIINYLIHQGLLTPDLQLTIPSPELRDLINHVKNNTLHRSNSTENEPNRLTTTRNQENFPEDNIPNNLEIHHRNPPHPMNPENTNRNLQYPRNPPYQRTRDNDDNIHEDTLRRLGSLMNENQSSATNYVTSSEFRNTIDRIQALLQPVDNTRNHLPTTTLPISHRLPTPRTPPFNQEVNVDIFHHIHNQPITNYPPSPTPFPILPPTTPNATFLNPPRFRPSQTMTPDQIKGIFKTISSPINILTNTNPSHNFLASIKPTVLKPLTSHRSPLTMLPDTTDSTKEFDLQCLAADFYLTVYNIDTTHQNSPTNYTISPNHPRNYGLAEHQAFFDSQTKTKDKYYTPKLPATNINDITFVRYVENLYSLFEDCPLIPNRVSSTSNLLRRQLRSQHHNSPHRPKMA